MCLPKTFLQMLGLHLDESKVVPTTTDNAPSMVV
jgi:hypothetical protein